MDYLKEKFKLSKTKEDYLQEYFKGKQELENQNLKVLQKRLENSTA